MKKEKFEQEIFTLKKFYELYCINKHTKQLSYHQILNYKNDEFNIELNLCKECFEAINYSFDRLQTCPHEIKPRCRKCPSPCYEKEKWKNIAKVMKYSAIKLSLGKIKSRIIKILD